MRLSLKQWKRLEEAPPSDWPHDTGPALLEVLSPNQGTEEVRCRAAIALGPVLELAEA
jgi:hypothetical protein